jgi:hypothetical protein
MKRIVFLTTLTLAIVLANSCLAADWITNPANGHQYTVIDCISWTDAENKAIALGGYLATISDMAENKWVLRELSPLAPGRWAVAIGMYQPDGETNLESKWVWVTSEPFTYTNWDQGEPNGDTGENYGYMFEDSGKWNDGQLNWPVAFVEVGPIPEPSALLALVAGFATVLLGLRKRRR